LKPANVLLSAAFGLAGTDAGGTAKPQAAKPTLADSVPKIVDFGLAKQIEGMASVAGEGPHTSSGAVLGTPAYMAPEQAGGKSGVVGPAADVYALGAILYECLTGQPPFQAESVIDLLMKVASQEPDSPRKFRPDCPRDLETICLKCLEKAPKDRFGSAGELADELGRFMDDEPIQCRPPGRRERLGRALRRHKELAYLLAGASAAALISLIVLALWYPRTKTPEGTVKSPDEEKMVELPDDLRLVPRNSSFFCTVRLADLMARKDLMDLGERFRGAPIAPFRPGENPLSPVMEQAGVRWADLERATILSPETGAGFVVLLAISRPLDVDRVRKAVETMVKSASKAPTIQKNAAKPNIEPQPLQPITVQGKTVYRASLVGVPSFCAYSDRVLLLGTPEALTSLLERSAWAPDWGPLRAALGQAAGEHAVVVGMHPPQNAPLRLEFDGGVAVEFLSPQQRLALGKLESATLVLDLPPAADQGPLLGFSADLRLDFPDAAAAAAGQQVMAVLLQGALERMGKAGAIGAELDGQLATLLGPVRAAAWQQQGRRVELRVPFRWKPNDVSDVQVVLKESQWRTQSEGHLMQIGWAMSIYHNKHGRFPPAVVYGKDGKPLYSWRVALLPYLGQEPLYRQFKLDEPWDSEHNKKLLDQMPEVYTAPWLDRKAKQHKTYYQVFVGPRAAFEGRTGLRIADFTDGTVNTLLAAEAAEAVPWTAPGDLIYEPGKPLPKLGGHFKRGFHAVFASGSVRFFPADEPETALRAYITRNGREVPGKLNK
jgi:hypothetical protein